MIDTLAAEFESDGYVLVTGLVSRWERAAARSAWRRCAPPADWDKGHAVTDRRLFDAATHPAILSRVRRLIGDDVILWGVSMAERAAGEVHPWHTDLETAAPDGRTVSVWIAMSGVNRNSSLHLIAGSHRLGQTVQQVCRAHEERRGQTDPDRLDAWARELDPSCRLVKPDMTDGDAIFFDGRLWHGSCNTNRRGVRRAMIAQFAAPDTAIRIPNLSRFDEIDRVHDDPKPACVLVSGGTERGCDNRIVQPPARGDQPQLGSRVYTFNLPDQADNDTGWVTDVAFLGGTPLMRVMSCHASVLAPKTIPHPPHTHDEEEVLVVFDGELDLVLAADGDKPEERRRLRPGNFVYYPVKLRHTLQNPGDAPARYMMFKWKSHAVDGKPALGTQIVDFNAAQPDRPAESGGSTAALLLHGGTSQLRWLHSHLTTVPPGGGYEPHADSYDVALVTLEGTIETLGRRVPPRSVVYYPAGEMHGMRNVGDTPARYLVFEFHATMSAGIPKPFPLLRRRLRPFKHAVKNLLGR